jgi:chemotaxis protein MotB
MALKRKPHVEHENHERWLVSYADFITLLFAFFTVLYATSQADLKKQEEFEQAFKKQFAGFISSGDGVGQGSEVDDLNPKNTVFVKLPIERFPASGAGAREIADHVERRLERELPGDEPKETVTGVNHDAVGVKIQLAANKLFPSGSADLKPESAVALDRIGQLLREAGRKIIVEGHTDDLPIKTEKFPSNWELSAARATKIVRYLAARHKISPAQMVPVAYADQKPVAPNDSESNRARNRRIEIKIVTGSADL